MKKFLLAVLMLLPITMIAQEEKEKSIPVPQSENMIRLAAQLSKYGYANDDALSLIQAARLAKQAGLTKVEMEKIGAGTESLVGDKKGNISLDFTQLLEDAKVKAGDDGVLLALIDDVKNNVRGATNSARYAKSRVNSRSTDVYRISFRANELAMVVVVGDGDTDLDLYVYDENNNLITKDVDYTDDCVVTFTPRWTGMFIIKIVNRGNVYNEYVLRTN